MKQFRGLICGTILAAFVGTAFAGGTETYTFGDVMLSDGSTLSGYFTVDWVTDTVTDYSIVHSAGQYPSMGYLIDNTALSGISSGSQFEFDGSTSTLAHYVVEDTWTLSIDNAKTYGPWEWEILYLNFNAYTGEIFLDAPPLLGSRMNSFSAETAKTTWSTVVDGWLTLGDDNDDDSDDDECIDYSQY